MKSTPLLEIEKAVQRIAQELDLDLSNIANEKRLQDIIRNEVDSWQQSHHEHALSDDTKTFIESRISKNICGYGPLDSLLTDSSVWEVMVNSHDSIFVRRHGRPTTFHTEVFHDSEHLRRTIARILLDNGINQRKLEPAYGVQDAQVYGGSRLHVVHEDLTKDGTLVVNIRKFTGTANRSLDELTRRNMISPEAANFLINVQEIHPSIIFAGAPGSGKTTLLGALASELPSDTRVVIAEEVLETQISLPNVAHLQTRPSRPDRPGVDLRTLVGAFLRMSPDLAVVGEVRDKEALPFVLTLTSGIPGYTTIHASSARSALARLRLLVQISGHQIPFNAVTQLVTDAVDIVVHCVRIKGVPRVSEICCVEDSTSGSESPTFTTTTIFSIDADTDNLTATGQFPQRLRDKGKTFDFDLDPYLKIGTKE